MTKGQSTFIFYKFVFDFKNGKERWDKLSQRGDSCYDVTAFKVVPKCLDFENIYILV